MVYVHKLHEQTFDANIFCRLNVLNRLEIEDGTFFSYLK